jgi:hypothetical protein
LIINALNTQHDLILVLGHPANQGEACLWWKLRWLVYAAGTNTNVCARNYLCPVFLLTKTQPREFYQWIFITHFIRWQKINNRSLWSLSKDTRIYIFPIIRTYLLMLEHSDKNVISL